MGLFFKKKEKPPERAASSLSLAIEQAVLAVGGNRGLPVLPSTAQHAFSLITNNDTKLEDFVAIIEPDEALSSRLVKLANSAFLSRVGRATSLEEALQVIGLDELRCLLNASFLSDLFPTRHPFRSALWSHNLAVAVTGRILANRLLVSKGGEAFLSGLTHDIGKLLFLDRQPQRFDQVLEMVKKGSSFLEAEHEIFICNHCDAGEVLARRWHFPEGVIDCIRTHHQPRKVSSKQKLSVSDVIAVSNLLVHHFGMGYAARFPSLRERVQEQLEEVWPILGISPKVDQELLNSLKQEVQHQLDDYYAE